MTHTLYRSFNDDMPTMLRGVGSWLMCGDGRSYIDMSSSACMSILGHHNRIVIDRIKAQIERVPNVFGGFWKSEEAELAGELMAQQLGPWFDRVHFLNGGGEAVDLACKLAYQYHAEAGENNAAFLSLDYSYHGVGLLPFALTGDYPRYKMIQPYHDEMYRSCYVCHVRHPYQYDVTSALVDMQTAAQNWRPAAIIVETVGGPPLGAYPHAEEYLQGIRRICNEIGALMICDEILCGSGRCGALSYIDWLGIKPDIVLLGKGLSAGYVPMSAILLSKKVSERITKGTGSIMFGTANSNHTLGCAAVSSTISYMKDNGLYSHVKNNSAYLRKLIEDEMSGIDGVNAVRGTGYLFGIELVDPTDKQPLPPELAFHAVARKAIFNEGAVVYTKGQTVNGLGDFITIAPPATSSNHDLEFGMSLIARGLRKAYDSIKGRY